MIRAYVDALRTWPVPIIICTIAPLLVLVHVRNAPPAPPAPTTHVSTPADEARYRACIADQGLTIGAPCVERTPGSAR